MKEIVKKIPEKQPINSIERQKQLLSESVHNGDTIIPLYRRSVEGKAIIGYAVAEQGKWPSIDLSVYAEESPVKNGDVDYQGRLLAYWSFENGIGVFDTSTIVSPVTHLFKDDTKQKITAKVKVIGWKISSRRRDSWADRSGYW